MLKFSQVITKCLKNSNRPLNTLRVNKFSTTATIVAETKNINNTYEENEVKSIKPQRNMVAAAFASLHSDKEALTDDIKTPMIDEKLKQATSVQQLLSVSEGSGISRRYALKVVSILSEWTSSGKVKLSDFENDPRFVKLCRILTKSSKSQKVVDKASRSEDLSTILNVTADDEAARLVESITLPQMVKVMSSLGHKQRRSTVLLRSLAYNITANSETLDLKQCGDLLYSMCKLNFIDENLITKISADICNNLQKSVRTSSVTGSIITSLGLLRFKNPELLDTICEWFLQNHSVCRPQDIFGLFVTLAVLNYTPSNSETLYKVLVPQLNQSEAGKALNWLDIVWSLVLLNQASSEHVSSVLDPEFVNKLEGSESLSLATKLKLLNIDAAAQYLLEEYKGARLSNTSSINSVDVVRNREKKEMIDALITTLRSLIQSPNNLETNINTGLGVFIDAKCLLDSKCGSLALDQENEAKPGVTKVAILVLDYHDMCRGKVAINGISNFAVRILAAQNYKVITVPYTEFRTRDKLVHRVQYLESKLKQLVK